MLNTRIIRRRVKSIKNTRQITKAMEIVSATKMRKAVASTLATRPYATASWNLLGSVSRYAKMELHPLLSSREEIKRVLFLIITSDKGLCGAFNANVFKTVIKKTGELKDKEVSFITLGKKGQSFIVKLGEIVIATWTDLANNPTILDTRPVAKIIIEEYVKQNFDQVLIAYTDYVSGLKQAAMIKQLLPIRSELLSRPVSRPGLTDGRVTDPRSIISRSFERPGLESTRPSVRPGLEYLFEPSPEEVLSTMLPRLVEMQIYQAILESAASEHSSRMMAMRNATDAASDLVDDLTLSYNQARQAGITKEIAEIATSKAAME